MTNWVWLAGVILQAPHHGDNVLVLKHDVQERRLIDEKESAEDVVQVMEPGGVLQVLADVEEFEQFGNVAVPLYCLHEALAMHGRGDGGRNQVKDLFKLAEFAEREFDDGAVVETRVRGVTVFLLCDCH